VKKGFALPLVLCILIVVSLLTTAGVFIYSQKRTTAAENCLELQKEHTHEKYSQAPNGSFLSFLISDAYALTPPPPEYEFNKCEEKAASTKDVDELIYLSQSKDPLVIIRIAQNPLIPVETQWKLYKEVELKYDWSKLEPFESSFQLYQDPQEALRINLLENNNLDSKIAEDALRRYTEKDPKFTKREILAMLGNGYGSTQNLKIKNIYLSIAKLNQIEFNRVIAMFEGLDEETINYLGQEISYELDKSGTSSYDKSSPLFMNYPSPNFEVHSILLKNNVAPKPIILAHLKETRDYQRLEISQKNLSSVSEEILSDEMRDYFFASTISNNGVNNGRYTYVFDLLFHGIAGNDSTSKETLQTLLNKYSNSTIDELLNKQLDYIPNMEAIDSELKKKYPSWHEFEISALRNALMTAKKNLNKES